MEGYRDTERLINENLEERAYSEYSRLAGILGNSVQFNENLVRSIVNASYQNATWSQRLWNHQASLSSRIGTQLASGILAGKSSTVLAREIQKVTQGSTYACQRLMRTELRRVQTEAAVQSMTDNGVTEYKFIVANGVNPCEECLALDGQVFKLSEMAPGKNAPPVHPSCHCCTAPYVDEAKWQRWLDGPAQAGVPWAEFEGDLPAFDVRNAGFRRYSRQDISDMARATETIASKHLPVSSKWSGKIIIDDKRQKWLKEWNCDILTNSETSPMTILHEQLHARSASHVGPTVFRNNTGMEESSVHFLTQEICRIEGIEIQESGYDDRVEQLRRINRKYTLFENDYIFARELMKQKLSDRELWLTGKVLESLGDDYDFSDYIDYRKMIGGVTSHVKYN